MKLAIAFRLHPMLISAVNMDLYFNKQIVLDNSKVLEKVDAAFTYSE